MASDSQRRFHSQTPPNAPSTATLFQSGGGSQVVQAAFARPPPSLRSTQSYHTLSESPYSSAGRTVSLQEQSISEKFSLSPDPSLWGATLAMNLEEPDDELHNPDPRRDRKNDRGGSVFTYRGLTNLGCLIFLAVGMVSLFAGYPMISYFTKHSLSNEGGFNIGGINASGQIPTMTNNYGLIDVDTPSSAHTYTSFADSSQWQLVFSDEFEVEGRTFWPGDDPYWEAVNLHYWQTNDLEWYYPDQVTTRNGSLEITLSEREMNNLSFTSGLISTWNKFCFTGGMVLASVSLPGKNDVSGLWPAVWSMGNLGRVGYGASLEGMWPYSYDACDVGTAPNQTINSAPAAAVTGNPYGNSALSYLPGQRLSRCTCKGESHPGPVHSDGTYVGRSAPEIDVFESQVTTEGQVSQSAQWAPMNYAYQWSNTSQNYKIPNPDVTQLNSYLGGVYQQSTSGVTNTNQSCYTQNSGCFSTYGYEYKPGYSADGGYISWITNDVVGWTLDAGALVADSVTEISDRPIPQEPMYLITNLGISENFQTVDFTNLIFPATMRIDWIRVYQPQGSINIGCDPKDFPTAAYINEYIEAYTNPNLTTWRNDFQQPFPKNNLTTGC
ncbi:glycoside hydrolase family 16 protein [Suillus discolor]|uniref:Glycoside hydrolase family 16 protein n=1 Tax=Suillus discolor TaxID=1912936 RepID=A0A9P7K119_9AGAM|nr:glycoside hydrolase family 16 protein [Suillus discolor]KAG2120710.1 glycoside hydrolase family 16 protein [Suillus discolor]